MNSELIKKNSRIFFTIFHTSYKFADQLGPGQKRGQESKKLGFI